MRTIRVFSTIVTIVLTLTSNCYGGMMKIDSASAEMDRPVADFHLEDVMTPQKQEASTVNSIVSLNEFKGKKNVVLFFMSEKCSHTKKYSSRLIQLMRKNKDKEIVFLGVRCSADDSTESIRTFAVSQHLNIPVLDDKGSAVARYYRVHVAPTFVLIDKLGMLRFYGAFDNDGGHRVGAKQQYLSDAIDAIWADTEIAVKRAVPDGCSVRLSGK